MYNEKDRIENNDTEHSESGGAASVNFKVILVDCIKGVRKFWYLLIIFALIGFGSMYFYLKNDYVPLYESRASFTVSTLNQSGTSYSYYYNATASAALEKAFPYIINSPVMTAMLKEELGVPYINGSYSASSIPSSNLFTISVSSTSAQDAYDILNAIIKCYPEISDYVIGESNIEFVTQPEVASEPFTKNNIIKDSFIGAAAGASLWILLILLYAFTRTTIRSSEDISTRLGQNCIAEIPFVKRRKNESASLLAVNKKLSFFSEAYRTFRLRLMNFAEEKNYKIFAVTSTMGGEGKSTVSFNIAYSLASAGKKVALVDLDLKRKSIQQMLFPSEKHLTGINDAAEGRIPLVNAFKKYKHNNLHVYCAGNGSAFWLKNYESIFEKMRSIYDYVIIDCPPGGILSEAISITQIADSVLFVVWQDLATVRKIRETISTLFYSSSQIAGFVFNGVKADYKNYGGYKYGSYKYGSYKYNSYRYGKYGYYGKYGKYGGYGYGYGYGGEEKNKDIPKDESAPADEFDALMRKASRTENIHNTDVEAGNNTDGFENFDDLNTTE